MPDELGFHEQPCWFSAGEGQLARCGWLVVPENRHRSGTRLISLPVVIFRASDQDTLTSPLVFIDGGPGYRAGLNYRREIDFWWSWIENIPKHYEVIVLGLRGTGLQKPDIHCPRLEDPRVWASNVTWPPSAHSPLAKLIAAAIDCRDRLIDKRVDLSAYNSRETATDIEELRKALGISTWTLYGVSYGSRIALTVLRHYGNGVNSIVLDSVFPPDASATLDQARFLRRSLEFLFSECRSSATCSRRFPDIEQRFEALREKLSQEPIRLRLSHQGFWPDMDVSIDDRAFLELIRSLLYLAFEIELLPHVIERTLTGDFGLLQTLANTVYMSGDPEGSSLALMLSYLCHEKEVFDTSKATAQAIDDSGNFRRLIQEDRVRLLCPYWPAGKAEAIENTPVESDIPALLLTGAYDPVTPPELAWQAAEGLTRSHVIEFRNASHGILGFHPCAAKMVAAFLAEPSERPDPSCPDETALMDYAARWKWPEKGTDPR